MDAENEIFENRKIAFLKIEKLLNSVLNTPIVFSLFSYLENFFF
jgi:hypothetical protein